MQKQKFFYKTWTIYCSFIVAIFLQITFYILQIQNFCPSWTMIILIYWIIMSPRQINIGTGFILGFILDVILGSILGIHALSLSILSYLITCKIYCFKYVSVWMQSCLIMFFSLLNKIIILLTTFLCIKMSYSPQVLLSCILDGSIWPIVVFLMRKIYHTDIYHI